MARIPVIIARHRGYKNTGFQTGWPSQIFRVEDTTWTIAKMSNLAAWYSSIDETDLSFGTAPALQDGDMETSGTAAWTPINNPTLTKETISPYEGTQCLRVARNTINNPYVRQTVLTTGNWYHLIAHTRGNMVGVSRSRLGSGGTNWDGRTNDIWRTTDEIGVASNAQAEFQTIFAAVAGTYCEWDDITLDNISVTQWNARAGSIDGNLSQAGATEQGGWYSGSKTVSLDDDAYALSNDKTDYDILHAATGECHLYIVMRPDDTSSGLGVVFGNLLAATETGLNLSYDAANQNLELYIGDASGAYESWSATAGTTPREIYHLIEFHRDGTNVSVVCDGVELINETATKLSATTSTRQYVVGSATATAGASLNTNAFHGKIGDIVFCDGSVPASDTSNLRDAMTSEYADLRVGWTPWTTEVLLTAYDCDTKDHFTEATYPSYASTFESGISSWTSYSTGILTLVTSSAPQGQNYARAECTNSSYGLYRGTRIAGNRYSDSVMMRVTANKFINMGTTSLSVSHAVTTDWQTFTQEQTSVGSANFIIFSSTVNPGHVVEVDNLVGENLSRTRWDPKASTLSDYVSNGTAAQQPYYHSSTATLHFDGSADRLVSPAIVVSQPMHVFIYAKVTGNGSGNSVFFDGGAANQCAMYVDAAGTTFGINAGAAGPTVSCSDATYQIFEAVFNGASSKVAIDGGTFSTGNAGASGVTAWSIASDGAAANHAEVEICAIHIFSSELSSSDRASEIAFLQQEYA